MIVMLATAPARAAMPENIAPQAKVWASSEHNASYQARFAVDGRIPAAGTGAADRGHAWAVLRSKSGDRAEFSLQWPAPVEVAEIVCWGRTAWSLGECWHDYEVYLDQAKQPAAKGSLRAVHGPQRIRIAPAKVTKITLRFLNSHAGANPGASEIQVFASRPSDADLAALGRKQTIGRRPEDEPVKVAAAQVAKLRTLIDALARTHGSRYAQAGEHRARLTALESRAGQAGVQAEMEQLQRDVLLFDVDRLLVVRRHEILASHVYTYHYEGFRPGAGLYVVEPRRPQTPPKRLVDSPTGQILDLDLSYDGRQVLFSWRPSEDSPYHVWTVGVDGAGLRQLTSGPWHDYNPCWLADGGIAFLSTRAPQFAYCWHAPVGILYRMQADGSRVTRLSANYLNDFTPAVMDDGRIIYTRWEYVDRPAIPIQSLWTLNPDGTGLLGYFGNRVLSPGTFMEARPIPGTAKIICTMTGHNGPTRGAIGVVDRSRGVNAQEAIENVTPDVPLPRVDQGNGNTSGGKWYSGPWPLDAMRFLVAARGPVLARTLDGSCQSVVLPAPADGMQYFCPRPIASRRRPPMIASALPEGPEPYATVFLQDVYNGLSPTVTRGEVKAIRVVREMPKAVRIDPSLRAFDFQFPVISCGATYAAKTVLGEVPVEADGSACFRVPAGMPVYFMAVDAEGRAVQRMRTFTHFMPGEVQGCVGCHERRLDTSRARPTIASAAMPKELRPPEWGVRGFGYSEIVQPVLDRYCAGCHNPVDAPGRVDLSGGKTDFFNVSYETLARENRTRRGSKYVSWICTNNGWEWNILEVQPKSWGSPQSRLAEIVLSGHPDERGKARFEMDEVSRRRIFAWIDCNVPYYSTSETAYPERRGCRQIVPENLEAVLADVAARRCAECHQGGKIPRREWVRITEPELNPFLLAPLARSAGGSQRCGRAVFADRRDPDYQAILTTFEPLTAMLKARPRMDMPGGVPATGVCRECK
jgi:hypothetical protein